MTDLLEKTLVATGLTGITYTFRIPSIYDEFKISARAKDIRKKTDPKWDGIENGLDFQAQWMMRGAATFEVMLESASDRWPYAETKDGKPVIDSEQWPSDKFHEVDHVYGQYVEKVSRFRNTGSTNPPPDGTEAVAGEPDTADKPVRSKPA